MPIAPHDALAHTARKLVRVVLYPHVRRRNPHLAEHIHHRVLQNLAAEALVDLQRLAHLVLYVEHRVQGGHRVLQHHAYPAAADLLHLALVQLEDVLAFQQNLAADYVARRRRHQPHYGQRRDRLARTGFAHDAQRLATPKLEVNAVNRLHHAPTGHEVRAKVSNVENDFIVAYIFGSGHIRSTPCRRADRSAAFSIYSHARRARPEQPLVWEEFPSSPNIANNTAKRNPLIECPRRFQQKGIRSESPKLLHIRRRHTDRMGLHAVPTDPLRLHTRLREVRADRRERLRRRTQRPRLRRIRQILRRGQNRRQRPPEILPHGRRGTRTRGGTVRGTADLSFSESDGQTRVDITGDAQVTGIVARVGQRLLGGASRMMMNQFFNCLKTKIEA